MFSHFHYFPVIVLGGELVEVRVTQSPLWILFPNEHCLYDGIFFASSPAADLSAMASSLDLDLDLNNYGNRGDGVGDCYGGNSGDSGGGGDGGGRQF